MGMVYTFLTVCSTSALDLYAGQGIFFERQEVKTVPKIKINTMNAKNSFFMMLIIYL